MSLIGSGHAMDSGMGSWAAVMPRFMNMGGRPPVGYATRPDRVELRFSGLKAKPGKVAIIGGAGNVGSSLAKDLAHAGLCRDVALVDMNESAAKGKALDIRQACAVYGSDTRLVGGNDYSLLNGSDVVVITAGSPRRPGMSRDDLLLNSTKIIKDIAEKVKKHAPDAMVIMVSNPMDAMAQAFQMVSGFPSERVIGMGGVLDSARYKAFIVETLQARGMTVGMDDVDAMVLGGHGDTMVPVVSQAKVNGVPLTQLLDAQTIQDIVDRTRNGGAELVNLLNMSGYIAPGAAIAKTVQMVLEDNPNRETIPCSVLLNGQYGARGIYMGVPAILGRKGLERVVDLKLSPEETRLLAASANALQANVNKLPGIIQNLNQAP